MIPSEYKLDFIVARLIERLEGTRRSFGPRESAEAHTAFERISKEYVAVAMGEFREVALDEQPDLHVIFVEREVQETFLPRYTRLAVQANATESKTLLGGPVGRLFIGILSLALLILLPRMNMTWLFYPSVPFLLTAPFFPDVVRWLYRRKHRTGLEAIVQDMGTIQSRNNDYEPVSRLRTEEHAEVAVPSAKPNKEMS